MVITIFRDIRESIDLFRESRFIDKNLEKVMIQIEKIKFKLGKVNFLIQQDNFN